MQLYNNGTLVPITAEFQNVSEITNEELKNTTAVSYKTPLLGIALSLFALFTILGNALVIVSVIKERYLRNMTNYLIVSLAVSDLLMGAVVMPFSISMEVSSGYWWFGVEWCDAWHSLDVLGSTASILNLCAISLDRYLAITSPITYHRRMTPSTIAILITVVWTLSSSISFPAIAWWKSVDPQPSNNECIFTEDSAYLIISSLISFYIPLVVMLFMNGKIYRAAAMQIKSLRQGSKVTGTSKGQKMTLRLHRGGAARMLLMNVRRNLNIQFEEEGVICNEYSEKSKFGETDLSKNDNVMPAPSSHKSVKQSSTGSNLSFDTDKIESTPRKCVFMKNYSSTGSNSSFDTDRIDTNPRRCVFMKNYSMESQTDLLASKKPTAFITRRLREFQIRKKFNSAARERKAAKTLGIVMGVFVICWAPFFFTQILFAVCKDCVANPSVTFPIFTWLGYINSAMNPVIYSLSMKDFRRAFVKLLCGYCPWYKTMNTRRKREKYLSMSGNSFSINTTCLDIDATCI